MGLLVQVGLLVPHQLQWGRQALKGSPVRLALKVLPVQLDPLARPAHRGRRVRLDLRVQSGPPARQERWGLLVRMVPSGLLACLALSAPLGRRAQEVTPGRRDQLEHLSLAQLALQLSDRPASLSQARLGRAVALVQREQLAQRAFQSPAQPVLLALLGQQGQRQQRQALRVLLHRSRTWRSTAASSDIYLLPLGGVAEHNTE